MPTVKCSQEALIIGSPSTVITSVIGIDFLG
jgi:hypothetical protein